MGKLKQPLLSMEAHGTIGDHFTFQRSAKTNMLRTKPIPSDPRSLLQQYNRWRYQDAIWYWLSLTAAQKAAYRAAGSRKHLTAFAMSTSTYLNTLPDILFQGHLDSREQATTPATTLYGTNPLNAVIDKGLYFDGLDDRMQMPYSMLAGRQYWTIEAFINCAVADKTRRKTIYDESNSASAIPVIWFVLDAVANGSLRLSIRSNAGIILTITTGEDISDGRSHHVVCRRDSSVFTLFVDGIQKATGTKAGIGAQTFDRYNLGISNWGVTNGYQMKGVIDEARIFSRSISGDQILQHSLRRYPS